MATWQINSAGDFTLVSAFFADLDGDSLGANQEGEISGLISESAQALLQNVTPNGFWVRLRPNSANSFANNVNAPTNPLKWNSSAGAAVTSSVGGDSLRVTGSVLFSMHEVQWKKTGNYDSLARFDNPSGIYESCIFDRASAHFSNYAFVTWFAGSGPTVNNCVFLASSATGTKFAISADAGGLYRNCLFARNTQLSATYGVTAPFTANSYFQNCVWYNWEGDVLRTEGTQLHGENNATDKSSANLISSTGIQTNLIGATEWESVTWGSEDFRLKGTSAKLKTFGATSNTVAMDIIHQEYNNTIGPWQPAGGGSLARKPAIITSFGFGI